jgi:hypothetical protein
MRHRRTGENNQRKAYQIVIGENEMEQMDTKFSIIYVSCNHRVNKANLLRNLCPLLFIINETIQFINVKGNEEQERTMYIENGS